MPTVTTTRLTYRTFHHRHPIDNEHFHIHRKKITFSTYKTNQKYPSRITSLTLKISFLSCENCYSCLFCVIFRHFEERHLAHLEYIFKKESIIWGNYLPWLLVDERSCKKGGWVKAVANSSRPLISRQRHKSFWLHLLSFPHQIQKRRNNALQ